MAGYATINNCKLDMQWRAHATFPLHPEKFTSTNFDGFPIDQMLEPPTIRVASSGSLNPGANVDLAQFLFLILVQGYLQCMAMVVQRFIFVDEKIVLSQCTF